MNLGRKKSTSLEPPDRSLETSSKTSSRLPDQRAGCPPGGAPGVREGAQTAKAGLRGFALPAPWRASPWLTVAVDLRCRELSMTPQALLLHCWLLYGCEG